MGTSLISGLFNTIGNAVTTGMSIRAAKEQQQLEQEFAAEQALLNREFQTNEREATQAWNLAQWNRENEYNTPEAQMKRMVAAGINPNIAAQAIGGNATSPGQVRTSPQAGSMATSPGSVAGTVGSIMANGTNDMFASILDVANSVEEYYEKNYRNQKLPEFVEKELQQLDAVIGLAGAQKVQVIETANNIRQLTPFQVENYIWEINKMAAEVNLVHQQQANLEQEEKLLQEQTETEQATQELIGEQIETEKEIQGQIRAEVRYTQEMADEVEIKNRIEDVTARFVEATGVPLTASDSQILYDMWQKSYDDAVKEGKSPKEAQKIANSVTEKYAKIATTKSRAEIKAKGQQDRRSRWNEVGAHAAEGVIDTGLEMIPTRGKLLRTVGNGGTPNSNNGHVNPSPKRRVTTYYE